MCIVKSGLVWESCVCKYMPVSKLVLVFLFAWSGIHSSSVLSSADIMLSKLFDTLMVFLKEFFEKSLILKKTADDKTAWKITQDAKS